MFPILPNDSLKATTVVWKAKLTIDRLQSISQAFLCDPKGTCQERWDSRVFVGLRAKQTPNWLGRMRNQTCKLWPQEDPVFYFRMNMPLFLKRNHHCLKKEKNTREWVYIIFNVMTIHLNLNNIMLSCFSCLVVSNAWPVHPISTPSISVQMEAVFHEEWQLQPSDIGNGINFILF